ncbi:cobaltochelatase CobT-related protein [Devosia sp. Root413D1]|uniref:cobaltochelatase CobT-related protein n=1 Tax=Devosia sp. Root413D1 TaxID=1736531 RepID=UPI000A905C57|nr:cobalamin biosynthesis protein CobT [Devosia sp. Root413D1]
MSSWFDRLAERILALAGVPSAEIPDRIAPPPEYSPPTPRPTDFAYKIFTTGFDETVSSGELAARLGPLSPADIDVMRTRLVEFRGDPEAWWAAAQSQVSSIAAKLDAANEQSDTVVTVLVDHSGSMRHDGILSAVSILELTELLLGKLGIHLEVLGFTTTSWKGGRSRELWLERGRPPSPGRLCDLLHIVYRPASSVEPGPASDRYLAMLRQRLLRENVDGEALLWAAARLRTVPARRRILLVLSDGAPGDDSTISQNGVQFLDLQEVVEALQHAGDIHLCAIGIGHDVAPYYPNAVLAATRADIGRAVSATFEQALRPA